MYNFEDKFQQYVEEQKRDADPRRLEMLNRELIGTKTMIHHVLLPVFGSLEGLELYEPYRLGFECEGFSAHAETITRERFSLEKSKIRTMLQRRIAYVPFNMDELQKRPEACRNSLLDILDVYGKHSTQLEELTLLEREALRHFNKFRQPFSLADIRETLGVSRNSAIQLIKGLLAKQLIKPLRPNNKRHHYFTLADAAVHLIM